MKRNEIENQVIAEYDGMNEVLRRQLFLVFVEAMPTEVLESFKSLYKEVR